MNNEQLATDLHDLLGEVDAGWCAYKKFSPRSVYTSTGVGGCLGEGIGRMLDRTNIPGMFGVRHNAILCALGFTRMCLFSGKPVAVPDPNAMFDWNDQQRDPDVVKRRIKDAIEQQEWV